MYVANQDYYTANDIANFVKKNFKMQHFALLVLSF
ncbi:hypothetical protein OKW21_003942 [Catalinimonas alkaloidigena]|nr:hypothetical protein [Catalinimonas alkaloidigena]